VLYRVPWDERVEGLLTAREGTRVVADVDDLVFDPRRAGAIRVLSDLPPDERRRFEETIDGLRRTLAAADGVVVSTDPLRAEAGTLNDRVAVAYNTVSAEMVEAGARAHAARRRRLERGAGDVVAAYLSGTPTHDRDFLEAADAIVWALERYPRLRFVAAGFLSLDSRFDAFGERVVRAPYRAWARLPELLASVDVNLAPLERDNPFTDAKSCLKYLEAAVVGVPTIASARSDFRRAIAHGVNGLLADDPAAWRDALAALVEEPELRVRLGKEARGDVLGRHTTRARAEEAAAAFGLRPQTPGRGPSTRG
jgi:glycosyltransferase involved in cell wall biosynthesis